MQIWNISSEGGSGQTFKAEGAAATLSMERYPKTGTELEEVSATNWILTLDRSAVLNFDHAAEVLPAKNT